MKEQVGNGREKVECISGALRLLAQLRERVERELNSSTETTSPLQLTKPQVLSIVDFVVLQTIPSRTVRAKTHAFRIRVIPEDLSQVITISSATQGTHGSVEILKDGRLLYTPELRARQADTFTLTLLDPEGAFATETISIVVPPKDDYDDDEKREIFSSIGKIMDARRSAEHR